MIIQVLYVLDTYFKMLDTNVLSQNLWPI